MTADNVSEHDYNVVIVLLKYLQSDLKKDFKNLKFPKCFFFQITLYTALLERKIRRLFFIDNYTILSIRF